jgi:transcriptional regulator GlxA family with amidase domain
VPGGESLDARVQWAIAYMEHNFHHRLSIEEVAQKVNLSYGHFVRLFRAECSVLPLYYLKTLRVYHAKRLLEQTFLSVKEIANRSGMDQSHFVRDFRRVYGSSPGLHRATVIHRLGLWSGVEQRFPLAAAGAQQNGTRISDRPLLVLPR